MIDLHSHTQFSDGELSPAEHVRRAQVKGYSVIAITDHADASNIDIIVPAIRRFAEENNRVNEIKVICGIELTHVLPESVDELVKKARGLGADLVNVHGETVVEPVLPGTNMAAIDAGVDVLCHPGLITEEEVMLAGEKNIVLELTTRKGHSLTNAHVYALARKCGVKIVLNNDAHSQHDLVPKDLAEKILLGCGVPEEDIPGIFRNSETLAKKILG
jgi:histidinol phosphatase-like PHP family hydrolase